MVMLLKNKRGSDMLFPPLMFIVLNIVFFGVLLLFVFNSSTGATVYEQAYAKQVALLIDEAKSDMQILVDFEEGVKLAEKNGKTEDLVKVEDNKVIVNLGSGEGYGYKYFSDYDVNVYDVAEDNLIVIKVGDKIWPDIVKPDFDKDVSDDEFNEIAKGDCKDYSELILKYSEQYGVNPVLVLAVMMQESNCNETADNGADVGLMQINRKTWCGEKGGKGLLEDGRGCREQLKNPETNIRVGVEILNGYYNYGEKTYQNIIKDICKNEVYQKKYLSYQGWNASLRLYNGPGCRSELEASYVENVNNKYASLGGEIYVA